MARTYTSHLLYLTLILLNVYALLVVPTLWWFGHERSRSYTKSLLQVPSSSPFAEFLFNCYNQLENGFNKTSCVKLRDLRSGALTGGTLWTIPTAIFWLVSLMFVSSIVRMTSNQGNAYLTGCFASCLSFVFTTVGSSTYFGLDLPLYCSEPSFDNFGVAWTMILLTALSQLVAWLSIAFIVTASVDEVKDRNNEIDPYQQPNTGWPQVTNKLKFTARTPDV
jgi:hypothetical protein